MFKRADTTLAATPFRTALLTHTEQFKLYFFRYFMPKVAVGTR